MVPPVEIGRDGVELLVGDGLLKQDQAGDRNAVREACLAPLSCVGRGLWRTGHGTGLRPSDRARSKLMDVRRCGAAGSN